MENFAIQIPQTPLSWITFFVILIISGFYITSRVRKADMDLLRGANDDLRKSIEDKGKEIARFHEELVKLQQQVAILEKKNKTLEDLVVTALKQYFFENPKVASGMQKVVIGE